MKPRGRIFVLGLAALLAGALILRIVTTFERVEEEIQVSPEREARRNPMLAAHRFLGKRGISSRSVDSLRTLPPSGEVLVLGATGAWLPVRLAVDLAAWVRSGGHLILGACDAPDWTSSPAGRSLMEGLEIDARCLVDPDTGFEGGSASPSRLIFGEPGESLVVEMPWVAVTDRAAGTGEEAPRMWVASSLRRGDGRITLLGRTDVFRNHRIREQDHARAIERLVMLDGIPAGVWLVHDIDDPDLVVLLWRAGWPALLAAAAALALLLWRSSLRFGPALPDPAVGSRSLMDHIEAVGAFLWRRRPEALLAAAREETLRLAALRRPHLARMDPRRRADALAALGRVTPECALRALDGSSPLVREEFTRAIATLESIRRSL